MTTRGRPPGLGKVPGSGRKKGSLDKGERLVIGEKLAADILKTYKRLGPDWLLKVAQERPDLFINQCLSRLLPPAAKDDPDVQVNVQTNVGDMSDFQIAQRVAFALSKAIYGQEEQEPALIEAVRVTSSRPAPEPAFDPHAWTPPVDEPDMKDPGQLPEASDPAYTRWIEGLPLTDEQRRDAAVVRETVERDISNYRGSSAEQCDAPARPSSSQPSAGERRRAIMNRRRDLL